MTRSASSEGSSPIATSIDSAAAAFEHVAKFGHSETIASIAIPAPRLSPAAIAEVLGEEMRLLWRDKHGRLTAGVGVTASAVGRGSQRFEQARDQARTLYSRVAGTKRPLFGGFAFEPGSADGPMWNGFGDARFELPSLVYTTDAAGDGGELRVNVADPLNPLVRRKALAELEHRSICLRRAALERSSSKPPPRASETADSGRQQYLGLVTKARDLVRSGRFDKLVTARARDLALEEAPHLPSLLGSIDASYGDCTLLYIAGDNGALIAATPEKLATIEGDRAETVALAGTVPLEQAATLHSDAKLKLEHQLTVNAIAAALRAAPGTTEIDVAKHPRLCRLRNLVHLETPISARLLGDVHIFDIAAALHPTPAIAGIPTEPACDFLRRSETTERGWYAGLVGWCNERGEGELVVALRAGLLRGREVRLYAGAGIVGDSVPETEWDETALKLTALESHVTRTSWGGDEK